MRTARHERAHTRRQAATCRSRDALPQTVNDIFSIFTFSRYFFEDIHASTLQQLRYIVINTNFVLLQQKSLDAALVGIFFCANFQNPLYTAAPYREPLARVPLPFRVEDHAPRAVRAAVAGQAAAAVFALRAEVRRIQPLGRDLTVLVLQIKPHRSAAE